MAKTPKSGSRMAQTRYDAANKRTTGLLNKGWPKPTYKKGLGYSDPNPAYDAYLKANSQAAKVAAGLKSKPAGSGKKK